MGEFLHPSNSVEQSGVMIDPIDLSPAHSVQSADDATRGSEVFASRADRPCT
jgi:hypothetical protein